MDGNCSGRRVCTRSLVVERSWKRVVDIGNLGFVEDGSPLQLGREPITVRLKKRINVFLAGNQIKGKPVLYAP